MGGLLSIMAMLVLQINLQMFLGPPGWGADDLRGIRAFSIVGCVGIGILCAMSLAFGIVGLVNAFRLGQTSALAWVGIATSIFAVGLWIFVLIDLFAVVEFLARRQGLG
jgi:hypothetical protein